MRKLLTTSALLLLLMVPVWAKPQVLMGTFKGVETGDYSHIVIEDEAGEDQSFFLTNDPSFEPFLDHPEKLTGTDVKVLWQKVERNIPEAGGKMEIDEALSIEIVSEED